MHSFLQPAPNVSNSSHTNNSFDHLSYCQPCALHNPNQQQQLYGQSPSRQPQFGQAQMFNGNFSGQYSAQLSPLSMPNFHSLMPQMFPIRAAAYAPNSIPQLYPLAMQTMQSMRPTSQPTAVNFDFSPQSYNMGGGYSMPQSFSFVEKAAQQQQQSSDLTSQPTVSLQQQQHQHNHACRETISRIHYHVPVPFAPSTPYEPNNASSADLSPSKSTTEMPVRLPGTYSYLVNSVRFSKNKVYFT
jgi:hypothetical protein